MQFARKWCSGNKKKFNALTSDKNTLATILGSVRLTLESSVRNFPRDVKYKWISCPKFSARNHLSPCVTPMWEDVSLSNVFYNLSDIISWFGLLKLEILFKFRYFQLVVSREANCTRDSFGCLRVFLNCSKQK